MISEIIQSVNDKPENGLSKTLKGEKNQPKLEFKYESNLTNKNGWWNYMTFDKKFYSIIAEIAGVKIDDFFGYNIFMKNINNLSKKNPVIKNLLSRYKKNISWQNGARKELARKRKMRAKKAIQNGFLPYCFEIEKSYLIPIELIDIIKDYLSENFMCVGGCTNCKKNKKNIDVVLSHKTCECNHTKCLECKNIKYCNENLCYECNMIKNSIYSECVICRDLKIPKIYRYHDENCCFRKDDAILFEGKYYHEEDYHEIMAAKRIENGNFEDFYDYRYDFDDDYDDDDDDDNEQYQY